MDVLKDLGGIVWDQEQPMMGNDSLLLGYLRIETVVQ